MSKIAFMPIRCKEANLQSPQNGCLYFTTDTRKIYLGTDREFIPMGGNSGFYYGNKYIEPDNTGNTPDPVVVFNFATDIEGEHLPQIDDLILNEDGCFYRVTEIVGHEIYTKRLTLQGTGPGSSTGGSTSTDIRLSSPRGTTEYFEEHEENAYLYFKLHSADLTNYISGIECSTDVDFQNIFHSEINLNLPCETEQFVNIAKYLPDLKLSSKVYLRVTDKYGATRSASYIVNKVRLQISSNQPELFGVSSNFDYTCIVGGDALSSRTIHYIFRDNLDRVISEQTYELRGTDSGSIPKTIDISNCSHGIYTFEVQIIGTIGVKTIKSEKLKYKVSVFKEEIGQPIFSVFIPDKTEQYVDIPISYLLTFGDNKKEYKVEILIDNKEKTTQILTAGTVSKYPLSFDYEGTYQLKMKIRELGIEYSTNLIITKYTSELPVIDINRDDLKVYLTAKDRTNNSTDKEFWPDYKNNSLKATLDNFYFRDVNGWLVDKNNNNYLKVSQGAKVVFNDYSPYDGNPKQTGLTIEIDFEVSGVTDYNEHLIECLSRENSENKIITGFYVTGDRFSYWAGGSELISMNIVENKRVKLAFVIEPISPEQKYPMCYTYLNGIISKAHSYPENTDFSNNVNNKGYLKINSDYGQINVYSVRFYNSALDPRTVLNNYQATLETLEMRDNSFIQNNIRSLDGSIDLEKIESDSYDLHIPYVKIIGGYQSSKDFTMAKRDTSNTQNLPVGKKDYRAIDIEVVYPKTVYDEDGNAIKNEFFENFNDFKLTTTFEDSSLNVLNGFGKTAKTGAIMYAQGTSSLEYPVKNLRVKLKGDKIKVKPDYPAVNLICFKADFMESSGSHNTGAANYIDDLYEAVGMSSPGQDQFSTENEKIVTSIKGHPCVIFWSKTGEKGTFEYIGKYNLNLDKATPEPFGFKNDDDFGYLKDESGQFVLDENGNKQNSIYCFEFLDNAVSVCNFLSDETSKDAAHSYLKTEAQRYENTWYENRTNEEGEIVPGWCIGFESRYPEDKKGVFDADALWPLAKWVNELYEIYQNELAEGKKPSDVEYEYEYTKATSFDSDALYFEKDDDGNFFESFPTLENFAQGEFYTRRIVNTTYAMDSINRFRNEYWKYLDPEFLVAYYVITEALLMADSRVKNMMIATWGKEWRYRLSDGSITTQKPTSGTYESYFGYIWYPIFYDMDTMFGLNNEGLVEKNYFDEDTDEGVFNGDEALWKLTRDSLSNEIIQFYNRAENANNKLSKKGILPYFNDNQAYMANETFYNEDAFYKYINTFRKGYTNHLDGTIVAPGAGSRLYAAQGDRGMMREWFVDNRIKYLRGKYSSTQYQSNDRIEFRLTYPKKYIESNGVELTEEQKKVNASIEAVPPDGIFTYKSMKTGFAGVKVGKNSTPKNVRFRDEEQKTIEMDTSKANGTETYLLGISTLADIGDLSSKYPRRFVVSVGEKENHLQKLIIGNRKQAYYNPYWASESTIGLQGFDFLEEFNLENCGSFKGSIDFSDSPRIKKIFLNGSSTSSLTLPQSGVIEELRIPTSITNLSIDSHTELKPEGFTLGRFVYDTTNPSEVNGRYVNDFSNLNHINIRNTPIDTYGILKEALIKANSLAEVSLRSYCFHNIEWKISDDSDVVIENGEIVGLKVLNKLSGIDSDIEVSPYEGVSSHAEALTGKIIVDVGNYKVNEYALYHKYHGTYPNLEIIYISSDIQEASSIKFYNSETIMGDPYYSVLTDGTVTLEYLTSNEGPNGAAISAPIKISSHDKDYTFNGIWTVAETETGSIFTVGQNISQTDFVNYKPNKDTSFVANYNSSDRNYKVTLYDEDGKTILLETQLHWNDNIGEKLKEAGYVQSYYNYKSYDDPDQRYEFKGWQTYSDYVSGSNNYFDLNDKNISGEFIAYAYYELENIYTVASSQKYFDCSENGFISLNEAYKGVLQGKITIPSMSADGTKITTLKNFVDRDSKITHIYFMPDSECKKIGNNAFGIANDGDQGGALKEIHLPASIEEIGTGAFYNVKGLVSIGNSYDNIKTIGENSFRGCENLEINELPKNLETLGGYAFFDCSKVRATKFPKNLSSVGSLAFISCPYVAFSSFNDVLTEIPHSFLNGAGNAIKDEMSETLIIQPNITNFGKECFGGGNSYYKNKVKTIYVDLSNTNCPTNTEFLSQVGLTGVSIEIKPYAEVNIYYD